MEKFGRDEWVAQVEERRRLGGRWAQAAARWQRVPLGLWFALFVLLAAAVPFSTSSDYIIRVAGNVALYATLALGLNLVVGYAGLLDLGYVAFYGLGAYTYAYLSSDFTGLHWPAWASIVFVAILTALLGLLLGSTSLRLLGDYLAIVTLGFGQIFVQLTNNLTRVPLPGRAEAVDLTGGPNGIVNLDPISLFGFTASTVTHYYYILLALLALTLVVVFHLNNSRIGRAWRSLREDELAAEAMGIPTRWLKLLAFAIGAGIAGLGGSVFAAWQGNVFPNNFDVTLLILLYTMVILGGLGSLPGVVIGAFILTVVPEVLREVELSRYLFYGGMLFVLATMIRPWPRLAGVLVGVLAGGYLLKLLVAAWWPALITVPEAAPTFLGNAIQSWLIIPPQATLIGNLAFGVVVALLLFLTRTRQVGVRLVVLVPTLYLLAFVWETRLAVEPSITRLLLLGVLLVVLMIYRSQGLLGQRRVEVI
jgi:branched-chain amino acid transport system permease protein